MNVFNEERIRQYKTVYGDRLSASHVEQVKKLQSVAEAIELAAYIHGKQNELKAAIEAEKSKRVLCFATGSPGLIYEKDTYLQYWKLFAIAVDIKGRSMLEAEDV